MKGPRRAMAMTFMPVFMLLGNSGCVLKQMTETKVQNNAGDGANTVFLF